MSEHGYWLVFTLVFLDQIGFPVPSFPVMLAGGALAATGSLNLFAVIGLGALGALLSDTFWFEVGRRRGGSVLKFICRTSLEPDSCIGRTQDTFSRRGTWTLVVSKFVPGMNVVASPMAGISGLSRGRFFLLNSLGSVLFAVAFVMPGYFFSRQVESLLALTAVSGRWLLIGCGILFAIYVAFKYARRAQFVRFLRVARISADELKDKLDRGEEIIILDLRQPLYYALAPEVLPGAIRMAPSEVASRHGELPRDRDIVLYCSCPDERTSTRAALLLQHYGICRVRPLEGGYDGWRRRNFPLVSKSEIRKLEKNDSTSTSNSLDP
jgi:membrane protein DedA with SNARE-associated domain/rhodanese-related sulfurtransferase